MQLNADRLTALFRSEARGMLVYFTRRTCEPSLAMDLMSETFAQAVASRRRFRGTTDAEARSWLYGIAHHQLTTFFKRARAERKALRRLGVETPQLSSEELERIEEMAGVAELRSLVAAELSKLSRAHQAALQLRVVDELSYPEVAQRLGVSEQTARARVCRGLRGLRDALEKTQLVSEEVAR